MSADFIETLPSSESLDTFLERLGTGKYKLTATAELGLSRQCGQSLWRNGKVAVAIELPHDATLDGVTTSHNLACALAAMKVDEWYGKLEAHVHQLQEADKHHR